MCLESCELQPRLHPRGKDEPARGRSIAEDLVPQPAHLGRCIDVLPVIDDEGARLGQPVVHVGEQICRDTWPRRARAAELLQHRMRSPAEALVALADRLDEIADMERPVPVAAVQLVPVDRDVGLAFPLPQQRRLSVAGIGGDDRSTALRGGVHPLEQPRSAQRRSRVVRGRDLVENQGIGVSDVRQSTGLLRGAETPDARRRAPRVERLGAFDRNAPRLSDDY